MDQVLLRMQADTLACYARIEGMKAANQYMACMGDKPRYNEQDFLGEAATLEHISDALRNY